MNAAEARADETPADLRFEEHSVEFHNRDVTLAGSLLLPRGQEKPPAVVFVHGAGRQSREQYRELGEYFASRRIAALIYDKRGVGESTGDYESHAPYKNLVNDALAAIAYLRQRPDISSSQIGLWGLSQGAYISAAAASRTEDVHFIVAVGASVADGTLFYYRDNLFRRYDLSNTLRDIAEKAQLGQDSLPHNLRGDISISSLFLPRSYPPPDQYVHPAWSSVRQPVLVMWGQLDQHQPVGESLAGMKNSLEHANNQKWTMIVLPKANHDLGISETGELHVQWRGYPPGALQTMTDWVHGVVNDPAQIEVRKQVGSARPSGVLSRVKRYESLRWYGNGTVQVALWTLFLITFLTNALRGDRPGRPHPGHDQQNAVPAESDRVQPLKRALCALNLLILVGMTITVQLVFDQMYPSCPPFLMYLPLLGTVSTLATVALMVMFIRTRRYHSGPAVNRLRPTLLVTCLLLFVPYMYYWNLIGYQF